MKPVPSPVRSEESQEQLDVFDADDILEAANQIQEENYREHLGEGRREREQAKADADFFNRFDDDADEYSKLFLDYRLAVNAAHFSGPTPAQQQAPSGTGATEVWEWQGPHGIRAAKHPPLPAYLAAPRLPAQLGAYLHPQHLAPPSSHPTLTLPAMSGFGFGAARAAAYDAAGRAQQRQLFMGMSAHDRHRKMVHDLVAYYGAQLPSGEQTGPAKSDWDVLNENFRFIRSESDDAADSWEMKLAKRYYSKLFKEYAIADLSRHKEGKVGLRWRTQKEVVAGRGQFSCGATSCEERRGLASFEVPFAYREAGERKQALVKVRVCPTHAYQLNYRKHKEAERAHKAAQRKEERRRRRKERRTSAGGSSKDKQRRRKRSGSCGDSGPSDGDTSESSSSSSQEVEEGERRRGGKRRRRDAQAERAPAAREQAAGEGTPAAAGSTETEFEAFLQGLLE
ncbi:FRA10AC1 like [Micractinium conductrix]|uniref:FRA10AC1 like n=1 Tax=Micractinium conductrix TaxID=554055 RepID=A0A2P6VNQ1_9CHLO|nr:FRA10AC1 like [Micractinium conductrix]|eukprot:PSC75724.1 FRA10AC1 like [Micractinium conductrix]